MKRYICVLLGVLPLNVFAVSFTTYDGAFYAEVDYPQDYAAGTLTGISDIYYTYLPYDKFMLVQQTAWLATGGVATTDGAYEVPADYDSVFSYADISWDDLQNCDELGWCGGILMLPSNVEDLKQQFDNYLIENLDINFEQTERLLGTWDNIDKLNYIDEYLVDNFNLSFDVAKKIIQTFSDIDNLNDLDDYFMDKFGLNFEQTERLLGTWDNIDKLDQIVQDFNAQILTKPALISNMRIVQSEQNNQIMRLLLNRLTNMTKGHSSGDVIYGKLSAWGRELYNYSRKSGSNGFTSNTFGVVLGGDVKVSDDIMIGVGYNYNNNSIKSDAKYYMSGNSFFIYGEYNPQRFYVNGVLGYAYAELDKNDITTKSLFAGANVGYETTMNLSPQMGLRYGVFQVDDASKYVKSYKDTYLTLVSGAKYDYKINNSIVLNAQANVTYDVMSHDAKMTFVAGNYMYITRPNKNEMPLGGELGLCANLSLGEWLVDFAYDFGVREKFQSHTLSARVKYMF